MITISKEEYQKIWRQLIKFAADEDVRGFYSLYIEYLDKTECISNERLALRKMAKMVIDGR